MRARTKFFKMYYKLPLEARRSLIMQYEGRPYSLTVIALEVRGKTNMSKRFLNELGYKDEVDE